MLKIKLLFIILLGLSFQAFGGEGKSNLRLQLPPQIYATPGVEMNIYFNNIVLTTNTNNYTFDVDCPKGANYKKYWRFLPASNDIGEFDLKINVYNSSNKLIDHTASKLIVVPKLSGSNKKITLLAVGDSLTNATEYVRRIDRLFKVGDNPKLKFIGSHSGSGKEVAKDGICHEGYGGWSWASFCQTWSNTESYRAKSKFLVNENGNIKLDFNKYFKKYNHAEAPDFVTVMLGINDIFTADDSNIERTINKSLKYMDRFITKLVESAPKTKIGIALPPPPANSQDAFAYSYKCGQTRWQYLNNHSRYIAAVIKKFRQNKTKNITLIPVFTNIDTEHGFPVIKVPLTKGSELMIEQQCNGVHPAKLGYQQIGDSFYSWLKYQLHELKQDSKNQLDK